MKIFFAAFFMLTSPLMAQIDLVSDAISNNTEEPFTQPPTFSEANTQAVYWLNLVDQKQFGSSWLEAGSILKGLITREQWNAAMKATRGKFGNTSTRKLSSYSASSSLPGGLQGTFMKIKYSTNYSDQPGMIEDVILMIDGSLKQWRVISYNIEKQ